MHADVAAKIEAVQIIHAVRLGMSSLVLEAEARRHREALREGGRGRRLRALAEVTWAFLVLGFTSFGGPNAQFGFLEREFVGRRRWIDPAGYAELVALAQFLPGPLSSKIGIALGTYRAGIAGAVAACVAYTLPSVVLMIGVAYGIGVLGVGDAGWLRGLKTAAVAVVAHAVFQMGTQLAPDRGRRLLLAAAGIAAVLAQGPLAQIVILATACVLGVAAFDPGERPYSRPLPEALSRPMGVLCLVLFVELLAGLPLARGLYENQWLSEFEQFYRIGALVFGGGHVVLPLMEAEFVTPGWISHDQFLAGYGMVQAAPGPLFVFSAFLGATMHLEGGSVEAVLGGLLGTVAIFLPAFLLIFGILPFWEQLRGRRRVRAALMGVNAAVVGLVVAALYRTMWVAAVHAPLDFAFVFGAFAALVFLRWPPWLVVIGAGLAGGVRDLSLPAVWSLPAIWPF